MKTKMKAYIIDIKNQVDRDISAALGVEEPMVEALSKSAIYSASGGKRMRAVFLHLLGQLFGVDDKKLRASASAIELVHAASLVMDDLPYMDDSQLRRGKPANHVVFGQDVALLSSVGLISRAMTLILGDENLSPEERVQISTILANSFGFKGLVAGQFVDLKLKNKEVDFSIIEFINNKKNTELLSVAAQISATLGNVSAGEKEKVTAFANHMGFALQLAEELEELHAAKQAVVKNFKQEKLHLVSLFGDEAPAVFDSYLAKAKEDLKSLSGKTETLEAFLTFLVPERD